MIVIHALRSVIFYLGFFSSLLLYSCFCLIVASFLSLPKRYVLLLRWNYFVLFWLKLSCGIRIRLEGKDRIPDHSVVIISNHQSPWETIYLYTLFTPVAAILKKELLALPFFGWTLALLKPIAIDRSRKFKARQQMLQQGKEKLAAGISVLIFPEGTRVPPGVHKPYQSGASTLAIDAGAKILPVAHDAGHYWPSGKFIKKPGTIKVVVGQAVDARGWDARELTQKLESWIRSAI